MCVCVCALGFVTIHGIGAVVPRKLTHSSFRVVSAGGLRRASCRFYSCLVHGTRWHLRAVDCQLEGVVPRGDALGDMVVVGDFWPVAFGLFQDTESLRAVRRFLMDATAARCEEAVRCDARTSSLSGFDKGVLFNALLGHVNSVPAEKTITSWFAQYVSTLVSPLVLQVARQTLRSHGAVLAYDFSVSDARQLSMLRAGKKRDRARAFGAVTGLDDVSLLPDYYARMEDRLAKELLLLTCLFLIARVLLPRRR